MKAVLFIFFVCCAAFLAATEIPAGNVVGTWTLAGSPYNVNGNIVIQNATTLTVQPGVTVNVGNGFTVTIQGQLLAVGTSSSQITWTAQNQSSGWGGLRLSNIATSNDSTKFFYNVVEYAKNTTVSEGGGLYINSSSKVLIERCTIRNNQARYGAGIYCGNSSPIIRYNLITNNTYTDNTSGSTATILMCGAGIYLTSASQPLVAGNTIVRNKLYYGGSSFNVVSSKFLGGGIYTNSSLAPQLLNNTVADNQVIFITFGYSAEAGPGIAFAGTTVMNVRLVNNILWGNNVVSPGPFITYRQLNTSGYEQLYFYYCDIQDGSSLVLNIYDYVHCYETDPLFVDPSNANYQLQNSSYYINRGTPSGWKMPISGVTVNSLLGIPLTGNKYDIGAWESTQNPAVTYNWTDIWGGEVSGDWSLSGSPYYVLGTVTIPNGQTLTVQPGCQVKLGDVVYVNDWGRLLSVGTSGSGITWTGIKPERMWGGIQMINTVTANDSTKIVYSTLEYACGHAVYANNYSKLMVDHCTIRNNFCANGAGINLTNASPVITNNVITNNAYSHPTLASYGAGIYITGSSQPLIAGNTISKNTLSSSATTQVSAFGAAIYCETSGGYNPVFINNTIADNTVSYPNVSAMNPRNATAGIAFAGTSTARVTNCILWNNRIVISFGSPSYNQVNLCSGSADPYFYYCDIQNSVILPTYQSDPYVGDYVHNLDTDPLFTDAANGDYSLQPGSPLINAGTVNGWLVPPLGEHSINYYRGFSGTGSHHDIGASESANSATVPLAWRDVSGGNTSGTWTNDVPAYYMLASSTIPNGQTLTVQPGITIYSGNFFQVNIQGCLLSVGTSANRINWTPLNQTFGWHGLRFDQIPVTNDSSRVVYSSVSHSKGLESGGGIYVNSVFKLLIQNSEISYNSARLGPGILLSSSTAIIDGCHIHHNEGICGTSDTIGALYSSSSTVIISNCLIEDNYLTGPNTGFGAGLYIYSGYAILKNNIISNNQSLTNATSLGAGLNIYYTNIQIQNCTFKGNRGGSNSGGAKGAAIYMYGCASAALKNCLITDNYLTGNGPHSGGGIYMTDSSPQMTNCTIANNVLYGTGVNKGAGVFCESNSNPRLINTVIWGNKYDIGAINNQIYFNTDNCDPNFLYCNIQDDLSGFGYGYTGGAYTGVFLHNYAFDPQFVDPASGNYQLQSTSQLINRGTQDGWLLPPTGAQTMNNYLGFNPHGAAFDIGAHESPYFNPVSITWTDYCGGNISGSLTASQTPYILGSLTVPNGQTLQVDPGVTIQADQGCSVTILGRLLSVGTATNRITWTALNPFRGWGGLRFDQTPVTNDSSKVVYNTVSYCILPEVGAGIYVNTMSKLLIQNSEICYNSARIGPGLYLSASSAIIKGCSIHHNNGICGSSDTIGALCVYGGSPQISDCNISNNILTGAHTGFGAGVYIYSSNPVFKNNIIANNEAQTGGVKGTGMHIMSSSPQILNCTFSGNVAGPSTGSKYGGAIYMEGAASAVIRNCLITDNSFTGNGYHYGGGIYIRSSSNPQIVNSTIANNSMYGSGSNQGAGVLCEDSSNPRFINTIIWGNWYDIGVVYNQLFLRADNCDPTFFYCDIQGGQAGFGYGYTAGAYTGEYLHNYDYDPLFVNPGAGNYQLQSGSNMINHGTVTGWKLPGSGTLINTYLGYPPVGNNYDLGAYESSENPAYADAFTDIWGGDLSGTLAVSGSPYYILGSLNIPNAQTLTVQEGCQLNLVKNAAVNVQGRLLSIGNAQNPITWTAVDQNYGWGGIRFSNTPVSNDSTRIVFNVIESVRFSSSGGGISLSSFSKVLIDRCTIRNNSSPQGAGIYCYYSSPVIRGNSIQDNFATASAAQLYGAGIYLTGTSSPQIISNTIAGNKLINTGTQTTVGLYGAALYCDMSSGSNPLLLNNTIADNLALSPVNNTLLAPGLYFQGASTPKLVNNILWNNRSVINLTTTIYRQVWLGAEASDPSFYYCDIQGGNAGFFITGTYTGTYANNIDADPQFFDPDSGAYGLNPTSPCINTGSPNLWILPGTTNTINSYLGYSAIGANYDIGMNETFATGYIPTVGIPLVNPAAGTYYQALWVTMGNNTPESAIHYTLDGTVPTESSPLYTMPLTLLANTTLKARAFRGGWNPSPMTTVPYVINIGFPPYVPAIPQNMLMSVSGWDVTLSWDPVTTSAVGLPLAPDGYVVLYNQSAENTLDNYYFLGWTTALQYTHYRVAHYAPHMFYRVIAEKETVRGVNAAILERYQGTDITWGELKRLLQE